MSKKKRKSGRKTKEISTETIVNLIAALIGLATAVLNLIDRFSE